MNKYIMKQDEDGCYMGLLQVGSMLHPRDKYGPYMKSEDVNVLLARHDILAIEREEIIRCLTKLVEILPYPEDEWWEDVDEETINTLEELGLIEVSPT